MAAVPTRASAKAIAASGDHHLRLRLVSLGLATLVCISLAYFGITRKFGIIAEIFNSPAPISVEVEEPRPPPPPPPQPLRTPPPVQQVAPTNIPAPPTPTDFIVDVAPEPPAPAIITNATFLEQPSGRDFERYFPPRALQRGMSGRVTLDCTVASDGRLACSVAEESPSGWGFGEASLLASRHFRVAPATRDGHPTSGGRLRVPMVWRAL